MKLVFKLKKSMFNAPRDLQDINIASWNEYFNEGGMMNQPKWLENNRLLEIRKQFEFLAKLRQE